jgi:hypothetical protein
LADSGIGFETSLEFYQLIAKSTGGKDRRRSDYSILAIHASSQSGLSGIVDNGKAVDHLSLGQVFVIKSVAAKGHGSNSSVLEYP